MNVFSMSSDALIASALALLILGYLVYSLLRPERF